MPELGQIVTSDVDVGHQYTEGLYRLNRYKRSMLQLTGRDHIDMTR